MAKEDKGRKVPPGVLLVAILALALFIVIEVAMYHAINTGNDDIITSFSMLSSPNIWVVGILAEIFIVTFILIFIGLLYLRSWARVLVMTVGLPGIVVYSFKSMILVSSIVGQIRDNVEVSAIDTIVLASSLCAIAVAIMSVRYMSRPNVILAFEAKEVVLIKRKISAIERKIHVGKQRCNAGEMSKAELAKLKAECLAKEKVLRGQIRHLDKVRLGRERKQKEEEDRIVKRGEEKQAKKEEKKAEKEERKAEKELEKEEKGKEEEEGEGTEKEESEKKKEE